MVPWKLFRHTRISNSDSPERNYERTSEEKALVRRLDSFLLTFGCLSQGESKEEDTG